MKSFKITVLIFIIFISGIFYLKAETQKLTINDAIRIALENNTDTKIAKMEIKKAEVRVKEAFGYALPTVDFSINFMHYIEKPKIPFIDFQYLLTYSTMTAMSQSGVLVDKGNGPEKFTFNEPYKEKYSLLSMTLANSYETKLTASQILFNSAVFKGIGASEIYLDLSRRALIGTAAKTVVNVKKAFYGVLLSSKMLEILKASLENAEKNLASLHTMKAQGFVSEYDLLSVQVQVENMRPTVIQMENSYQEAKNGLKVLLGIEHTDDIELLGDIVFENKPVPPENELIDLSMKNNYDLITFESKTKVDEAFIDLDKAGYSPTVAAFGSYSISGQSDNFDFMKYNTGLVGVSLSINLFNGLRTDEKVQQSQIQLEQTHEQLNQMKEFIKTQIKSKVLELKRVELLMASQDNNVVLAQKAYDISLVKYKEGTGTQLDIQNSDMALRVAKSNKLMTTYQYITAYSDLEQMVGIINPDYFKILN